MSKVSGEQYVAVYFPKNLVEDKEETYFSLMNIDCNFSRVLRILLDSIAAAAVYIHKQDRNYRHYDWEIVLRDKKTDKLYNTNGQRVRESKR